MRKAGTIIVFPVTMIAENRINLAVLSVCVVAIFEGGILRFVALVRSPKETVLIICCGVGDCCQIPFSASVGTE